MPNTTHLITKLLPAELFIEVAIQSSTASSRIDGRPPPKHRKIKVNLLNPTAEHGAKGIPVEYNKARSYIAGLYDDHVGPSGVNDDAHGHTPASSGVSKPAMKPVKQPVDIFVHVGMADGWDFVSIERGAYKQGFSSSWWSPRESKLGYYMIPDNEGKTVLSTGPCPWVSTPMGLSTGFEVDSLVGAVKSRLQHRRDTVRALAEQPAHMTIPVAAHSEPGSYLCGFLYYESLANSWVRGRDANVLFCHVPGYQDDASLAQGKDALIAIIQEAVLQCTAGKGK